MNKKWLSKGGNRRGFTLIELLVVIAIIGILSSVVLVSLNSARTKGTDTRTISDVQQARTALESGYAGGVYPDLNGSATVAGTGYVAGIASGGPDNDNLTKLTSDAFTESTRDLVFIGDASSASAHPTVYAIYGWQRASSKWFCIASDGTTNVAKDTASSTNCI